MGDLQRVDEKILPNGDIYIGNLEGLLPHGMGKYIWLGGTIYEGEWEKSKMTGKGRISWPSGAKYEGDFCGGFIHGSGTFSGPDGSIYTGPWLMNKQNGHGRKSYSNLDVYEGSWKEGIQEGIGRYVWSTGNAYIGNWKGGKMCGRGVMKWVNGDLFDGFWQDGLEHGSGYYKFADGGFYFGTWSRGLKDGRGTFFPAGSRLPPVKRWYDSVGYFDGQQSRLHCTTRLSSSEELQNGKPRARSTGSDRRCISNFLKGSGRISHRSTSLNGLWSFHDFLGELPLQESDVMSSSSLDEGQPSPKDENFTVYERDYMQGILMMERIRDKRLSKKSKWLRKCKEKEGTKPGETIIKGHKSYHLMLNLQLGIRYSVGKITPVPVRQVRSSDFGPQARIRMHFPKEGSQFTPSHYSIDFYWKDYCPIVFRNLREMFKIDAADYMMSICGCDGLKELSSPGKSGSIFYLSQDERFVIKTLKKPELKILLKMLPKYYNHVESHDNTLITKFFGLHRIKLKGGHKVRFVVMGNMFCTELHIHRRYDLKGSSHGRSSDPNKINGNTTLKDLDLAYVFHMQKSWRESLFKQLSLDCAFLESQCIIDYSLLLGLHFRAPEHLKDILETPDAHATSSADNGEVSLVGEPPIPPRGLLLVTHEPGSISAIQGSHIRGSGLKVSAAGDREVDLLLRGTGRLRVQLGVNMPAKATHKVLHDEGLDSIETDLFEACDVVLYLGIIDILQDYNVIKKIEHTYKSLLFDPLSISAVEPKLYSKRFISFLEKVFPEQV